MVAANVIPFPSDRVPPTLELVPSEWTEACRYLEGRPITFDGQPWVRDMLDDPTPWQVWKTSRQVAKSTSFVNLMLCWGCNMPNLRMLYVAPTNKQTVFFSEERLRAAIVESPPIADHYWDPRTCRDRQLYRSLTTPAFIHLAHCFHDADTVRGMSTHILFLDELQDLSQEILPVLEQVVSAATRNPDMVASGMADVRRYAGTPRSFDTALEKAWERSTQNEWLVPCTRCGGGDRHFWNLLDERNISRDGLICKRCQKPLDWTTGQWVSRFPDRLWSGWHANQLMATEPQGWIRWERIWDDYQQYPTGRFLNEVLGVSHDTGDRPVTLDEVKNCCLEPYTWDDIPVGQLDCFAGLDWGFSAESDTSYTVLTIYALVGNRFQLQYAKRFKGQQASNPNLVLLHIKEKMAEYNVRLIGLDRGVGHMENERLKSELGTEGDLAIIEYAYVGQQKEEVKWNEHSGAVQLERTVRMDRLFEAIRQRWLWWPRWDLFETYAPDVLAPFIDYNPTMRTRRYLRRDPDDFFHATLFAWEAFCYYNPDYNAQAWRPTIQ